MTSFVFLKQALLDFLEAAGIAALGAFPQEDRKRYDAPLVLASVKELAVDAAGFHNYLGDAYDKNLNRWEERFGLSARVTFQLDLYSPRGCGEAGVRELMDSLGDAFSKGAPAELSLKELRWGKTTYDGSSGFFRAEGEAACEGVLYAGMDVDGGFLGFEVRGGITIDEFDKP